jgi:hypothetical protein
MRITVDIDASVDVNVDVDQDAVASRPRFGDDLRVLSWYRPAEMKPSWVETSWKDSAG